MRPFSSTSRPFGSCSLWRTPSGSRLAICSHSAGFSNPMPVRWVHRKTCWLPTGSVPERPARPAPPAVVRARHAVQLSNLDPLVLAAAMATGHQQAVRRAGPRGDPRPPGMGTTAFSCTPEMRRCAATGYHRHALWLNPAISAARAAPPLPMLPPAVAGADVEPRTLPAGVPCTHARRSSVAGHENFRWPWYVLKRQSVAGSVHEICRWAGAVTGAPGLRGAGGNA